MNLLNLTYIWISSYKLNFVLFIQIISTCLIIKIELLLG